MINQSYSQSYNKLIFFMADVQRAINKKDQFLIIDNKISNSDNISC